MLSRETMVEAMRGMLADMEPILDYADIPGFYTVPAGAETLTHAFVKKGYDWLSTIFQTSYRQCLDVWKLLPIVLWKRYKTWGDFEEHREVTMLMPKLKALKMDLKSDKRPDFFKKGKISAKLNKEAKGKTSRKGSRAD